MLSPARERRPSVGVAAWGARLERLRSHLVLGVLAVGALGALAAVVLGAALFAFCGVSSHPMTMRSALALAPSRTAWRA
ncbi:MAG: hypothetical protein K0R38_6258 [Polyangiaceae bacterium]|jgi:hypothetical protein|nr:hypothetical protein [Polyangiaceae bacterium]